MKQAYMFIFNPIEPTLKEQFSAWPSYLEFKKYTNKGRLGEASTIEFGIEALSHPNKATIFLDQDFAREVLSKSEIPFFIKMQIGNLRLVPFNVMDRAENAS